MSEDINDYQFMRESSQQMRADRNNRFEVTILPRLHSFNVEKQEYKYVIATKEYGIIDVYPKANKLLIRNQNKWIKPAVNWILNKLLKETK